MAGVARACSGGQGGVEGVEDRDLPPSGRHLFLQFGGLQQGDHAPAAADGTVATAAGRAAAEFR